MKKVLSFFRDMRNLAVLLPLVLIVSNIALCFTEGYGIIASLVNIFLPLGVYMLLMGLWKRTGIMTWLMLPFMIFAGFQIVLLYLYGGSVIAVDMFLNVVTTNVSEATALLANLLMAMGVVIILYVPALIWGAWAIVKVRTAPEFFLGRMRLTGVALIIVGAVFLTVAYIFTPDYSFIRQVFPVNAASNLIEACNRYQETSKHEELSAGFTYHAQPTHGDSIPETYMLVIGETARGDNWQLGGYPRETNPKLSKEPGLVFFPKSISESNTTHKSVPMLMSFACAENFDSITNYRSVITAFKEAGFHTAFISNQQANRSYTEFFGNEADTTLYIPTSGQTEYAYDMALIEPVENILADSLHRKKLIVVHTYGSHFRYLDRYPREAAYFQPDQTIDADASKRTELINAYDNTIRYTDEVLASLIGILRNSGQRSALLYASDHGEDIFDDSRNRFLHASPVPTYWQIHQATLVWLSPALTEMNPDMMTALKANGRQRISPQKSLFPTLMQLAGVESPYVVDSLSLVSQKYHPAPAVYLNDLNEALPLDSCGLKPEDMKKIKSMIR